MPAHLHAIWEAMYPAWVLNITDLLRHLFSLIVTSVVTNCDSCLYLFWYLYILIRAFFIIRLRQTEHSWEGKKKIHWSDPKAETHKTFLRIQKKWVEAREIWEFVEPFTIVTQCHRFVTSLWRFFKKRHKSPIGLYRKFPEESYSKFDFKQCSLKKFLKILIF